MAIAINSAANSVSGSQTWTHTCSGDNRVLVVFATYWSGSSVITGCTYNGVPMTQQQNVVDGYNFAIFTLVNPPTGANTVSVSLSTTGATFSAASVSLTGADQTNPVDVVRTPVSATSLSFTTNYDNSFLIDAITQNSNTAVTAGAGQTQRWNYIPVSNREYAGSTKPTTTKGSYSTSWSNTSGFIRIAGIAIREYVPGTDYTSTLNETLTLVDTYALQTNKGLTDALTLADNIVRVTAKSIIDTLVLVADHATQYVYTRAYTDTLTLTDNIYKTVTKTVTDTITVVDNIIKDTSKTIADTVTLVASIINNMAYIISTTDVLTITDNITKAITKTLTETVTLVEQLAKRLSAIRLTETITLAVVLNTVKINYRTLTETVTLTAVLAKVSTYAKSLTESIGLQDRLRGLLNGVNMLYNNKYTAKVVTYINKYIDPK